VKVLAVGDTHQKQWILDQVEKVAENYDKVVLLGDYLDNWGSSGFDRLDMILRVQRLVQTHPNIIALCGNHDLCYFNKKYSGMYSGWDPQAQMMFDAEPQLTDFMRKLPETYEIDGVTYSHAGLTDDWTPNRHPLADDGHMWVRPGQGYVYKPNQVFGHTPSKTCWEVQQNVWCVDTFSQYQDLTHFGDCSVLEIVDGKTFTVTKLA